LHPLALSPLHKNGSASQDSHLNAQTLFPLLRTRSSLWGKAVLFFRLQYKTSHRPTCGKFQKAISAFGPSFLNHGNNVKRVCARCPIPFSQTPLSVRQVHWTSSLHTSSHVISRAPILMQGKHVVLSAISETQFRCLQYLRGRLRSPPASTVPMNRNILPIRIKIRFPRGIKGNPGQYGILQWENPAIVFRDCCSCDAESLVFILPHVKCLGAANVFLIFD
jgi:hypothetical protein